VWFLRDGNCRPFLFGIKGLFGFSEELRDTGRPSCAFRMPKEPA
jgi:hypothetical protein